MGCESGAGLRRWCWRGDGGVRGAARRLRRRCRRRILPALSPAPTQSGAPGPARNRRERADASPLISPHAHVDPPNAPQPQLQHAEDKKVEPQREGVTGLRPDLLGFLGPFRRPTVPPLFDGR